MMKQFEVGDYVIMNSSASSHKWYDKKIRKITGFLNGRVVQVSPEIQNAPKFENDSICVSYLELVDIKFEMFYAEHA